MQYQSASISTTYIHSRFLKRDGVTELYLTASPEPGVALEEVARQLFTAVREGLEQANARILCERVFATTDAFDVIEAIRHDLYREIDDGVKPTSIAVERGAYGQFAGVQIHALSSEQPPTPLSCQGSNDGVMGRRFQNNGSTWLYINGLSANADVDEAEQARRMFYCAGCCLRQSGATMKSVARTWLWLRDICNWYDAFNATRNEFFIQEGLICEVGSNGADSASIDSNSDGANSDGANSNGTGIPGAACKPRLPASTGIGMYGANGAACTLDLIALPGAEEEIQLLEAGGDQDSAFAYGSAFSRAALVPMPAGPTLFISGTAAIDGNGVTEHVGNIGAQIDDTIAHVRALLRQADCTDDHVLTALVYCKTPEVERVFHERWPGLTWPHLTMIGDVCRPELLFEVEVTASPVCRML